tara:strand:+ start:1333 stop:3336 length:2004 start_codon:yes stop_codon:yes gene_type:complete
MSIQISFADLTYVNQGISSNSFPFGAALVASYAKKKLGNKIQTELFKYPDDFKNHLENIKPKIVCFTNYSWTFDISNEFSKRIKKKFPNTIIVFGGPNYPNEVYTQKKFLSSYRAIDFYIKGEGEIGFVNLFKNLEKFSFNVESLKKSKTKSGNCHYLFEDEFIAGETLPRIENLDDIPSPYLSGSLDKFFDKLLTPTIQTIRGCPFKCIFCQEGKDYFTKIYKFSRERVKEELEYIAKKVKVPNLMLVDSNFGMYKQDIEISKDISEIRKRDGWPKYIEVSLGKSKKILESISILKGSLPVHVAVQSTDADVLDNINRKNIPAQTQIEVIKEGDSFGGSSFSEVILGLPEDTQEKHFKSMFDMIDAGANVVRSHQLLMLPDSDMDTGEYRKKYEMDTRYRVQPKCFGNYELYSEVFPCVEIDELCVSNKTLSYEDYLQCRHLDLTVELFYNNGVFREYINLLNQHNISASTLIKRINQEIPKSELREFYVGYMKETKESLWKNKSELDKFMKSPGTVDRYLKKDLRANEQLKYRAMAFFEKMNGLHNIVLKSTKDLLKEKSGLNKIEEIYLNELTRFSLLRKDNLLSLDVKKTDKFHYNFIRISKRDFDDNPFSCFNSKKMNINFSHSSRQKKLILRYLDQFGSTKNNLGTILSKSPVNEFYRQIQ